jgi:hypothetical protein
MNKLFLISLMLGLLVLSGCQQENNSPPSLGADSNGLKIDLEPIKDNLSLEIVYQDDLNSKKEVKNFSCQKDSICPVYLFLKQVDFSLPPKTCTQIYGGPEIVTLSGSIDGEEFDQQFTRTDGCQIKRFESLSPLLNYARA